MKIPIPRSLHEVFGEEQTIAEIVLTLVFGFGLAGVLFILFPEMWAGLPLWRSILVFLLVADIFSGAVANFTRGTNRYYAARDKLRLVFIAIHIHLPVVAWLLGLDLTWPLVLWGYTIAGAFIVNACARDSNRLSDRQPFIGGIILAAGIALAVLGAETPTYFLLIALLFMLKVIYSFAVDHYRVVA